MPLSSDGLLAGSRCSESTFSVMGKRSGGRASPTPLTMHSRLVRDAVDRALHLPRPCAEQRAEFATASPRSLGNAWKMRIPSIPRTRCRTLGVSFSNLGWNGISNGIENVDRSRSGFDNYFQDLVKKIPMRPNGVFRGEFHIGAVCLCPVSPRHGRAPSIRAAKSAVFLLKVNI